MRSANVPLASLADLFGYPGIIDPFSETGVAVRPDLFGPGDLKSSASSLAQILQMMPNQMPQKIPPLPANS